MFCECPLSSALPDIPASVCPENFGQIQKIIFQRESSKSTFTTDSILTKSTWTPLLSALDDTKIVVTPYLQAPTTEAGEPITFGGGNETLGGIPIIVGTNPTNFTSVMRGVAQETIAGMRTLMCEKLRVFLVNQHGQIGCLKGTGGSALVGIPIRSLFIGDKAFGGLEAPDTNALNFSFLPKWSDNFVVVKPTDFNPLTDLHK